MKKILLFIVEGENDVAALAAPLINLQKTYAPKDSILFKFTRGDFTSDLTKNNMKNEVAKHVEDYCKENGMTKSDISQVILLLDTDGAFIPDEARIHSDGHPSPFYCEDKILYNNIKHLIKTHEHKRKNLQTLIELKKVVTDKVFNIYFVSCNFEHVAVGQANFTKEDNKAKNKIADDFAAKYENDAEGLLAFFNDSSLIGNEHPLV
jgi:hypothetical protein